MSDDSQKQAHDSLRRLVDAIASEVAQHHAPANMQIYYRYTVERASFAISEDGFVTHRGNRSFLLKPDWHTAVVTLLQQFVSTHNFTTVLQVLVESFGDNPSIYDDLSTFVRRVMTLLFEGKDRGGEEIDRTLSAFLADLRHDRIIFRLTAKIDGLVLLTDRIVLPLEAAEIEVAPITPEDLEMEVPRYSMPNSTTEMFPSPSILTITASLLGTMELHALLETAVVMLRLYAVQSVLYRSYTTSANTVARVVGGNLVAAPFVVP